MMSVPGLEANFEQAKWVSRELGQDITEKTKRKYTNNKLNTFNP
jgi:hypothetical protein